MTRRTAGEAATSPARRLDPLGKRALFEAPVQAAPDTLRARRSATGRDALFSVGPRERGTVVVDCSGCRARSRISIGDAAVRLASLSLWAPLLKRSHPHRITCPSCHEPQWCRIGWTE